MATPTWQPGTIYAPGALVQPASTPAPQPDEVTNGGFELGNVGWTMDSGFSIGQFGNGTHFQGTWSLQWDSGGNGRAINDNATQVVAGQTINASCMVQQGSSSSGDAGAYVEVLWYDASDNFLDFATGNLIDSGSNQQWKKSSIAAVAPAGAAFARFSVRAFRSSGGAELWVDTCTWDATVVSAPTGLVFKAVQAVAGYSGSNEPVWPLVNGQTVVDNEVTWEAVFASRVVWEATPILVSGEYEPEWPLDPDTTVADGTILWTAMNFRITDEKCPHSKVVAIAASKIFAADEDIVAFSATINPLDWSSEADAGYIPFGLNTYGSTPVTAMGLYRSNLVAFNSEAYQMWQVDPDPANMAILDASPVACLLPKSVQPVSNDLVMCTPEGVRNIGIAGASTNLQAGYFGAQVDPLVLAKLRLGEIPIALMWPAMGQYWLIFGDEAFVLTMNGGAKDQSWSRYVFPYAITDWCILEGDLYLRTDTDLVWKVDPEALTDDQVCSPDAPTLSGELDGLDALLTWTAANAPNGPVEFYNLYNADTDTIIATVDADTLEYADEGLDGDTTYRYFVTAVGVNESESEPSNIVELTTAGLSAPVLSGEIAGEAAPFTAELSWTASLPAPSVDGYRLYNADDDTLIIDQVGLTYSDGPLGLGETKAYYVIAYGASTESPRSNTIILDTADTGTVIDIFTSDFTWTKRTGLTSADVYVIAGGSGGRGGGGDSASLPKSGGAGAAGGISYANILAADLPATVDGTVGAGGTGGDGGNNSQNGSLGTVGGDSTFGAFLSADGGGTQTGANGANGGSGSTEDGGDGGDGRAQGGGGSDAGAGEDKTTAPGGGGGGAVNRNLGAYTVYLAGDGGDSGAFLGGIAGIGQSASSGAVQGGDGADGEDNPQGAGAGGGGGGAAGCGSGGTSATGGDGGNGGLYGAGGGGGGAAQHVGHGLTSFGGRGGDGAQGAVIVINYISA